MELLVNLDHPLNVHSSLNLKVKLASINHVGHGVSQVLDPVNPGEGGLAQTEAGELRW